MNTLVKPSTELETRVDIRNPVDKIVVAVFMLAFAVVAGGVLVTALSGKNAGAHDYISYWAAGRQLQHGQNPYDVNGVLKAELSAGYRRGQRVLLMRNPPTSLFLVFPLGFVSARVGSILWFLLLVACMGSSIHLLWIIHGRPQNRLHLLGYCFAPSLCCLAAGQTSIFALLGLVLFFYYHRSRPVVAGIAISLCALKPHLFFPFFLVLIAWIFTRKMYRILIGFVVSLAGELVLAFQLDSSVWAHYTHMMRNSGIQKEFIPTIADLLRLMIGPHRMWLQFLPAIIGCVWALRYFLHHRAEWNWSTHGSILMLVSVLVAPYAWFVDQSVLWPAILQGIYASQRRSFLVLLSIISIALIEVCLPISMHSGFYVWPGIAWFVWYLGTARRSCGKSIVVPSGDAILIEN